MSLWHLVILAFRRRIQILLLTYLRTVKTSVPDLNFLGLFVVLRPIAFQ